MTSHLLACSDCAARQPNPAAGFLGAVLHASKSEKVSVKREVPVLFQDDFRFDERCLPRREPCCSRSPWQSRRARGGRGRAEHCETFLLFRKQMNVQVRWRLYKTWGEPKLTVSGMSHLAGITTSATAPAGWRVLAHPTKKPCMELLS